MAAAPRYKVYADDGSYQAAVKELEAGAMLMLLYGPGATVRDGHSPARTLWTEGVDGVAGDSYDDAVNAMIGARR